MTSDLQHLAHAVRRAEQRPEFVASVLARYRDAEHVGEEQVASRLGCSEQDYLRLALCRAPRQPSAGDFQQLAAFAGADALALARIFRRVAALDALHAGAEQVTRSTLLAAREREDEEPRDEDQE